MAKTKIYTTPVGRAKFCHLVAPSTKFKPEGEFDVTLLLEGQEAADLMALIDEAIQANLDEIKKNKKGHIKENDPPYAPDIDKEGNDTGATAFKFKQLASSMSKDGAQKYEFSVAIFDSAKKIIHPKNIGFGTKLKVAYEINPYYVASTGAGVQLRMKAVQIIELVNGERNAESYGFGDEDGYVEPTDTFPETDASPTEAQEEVSGDF